MNGAAITPCLWFDQEAEPAARFYVSVFPNSTLGKINYYNKEAGEQHQIAPGSVLSVSFTLNGQAFTALNGGPRFQFSEAISFQIPCETQDEVDYYWNRLTAGGAESQCGWLKDQYGLSWQVVPTILYKLLTDPGRASRVTTAMLKMKKLDIDALLNA